MPGHGDPSFAAPSSSSRPGSKDGKVPAAGRWVACQAACRSRAAIAAATAETRRQAEAKRAAAASAGQLAGRRFAARGSQASSSKEGPGASAQLPPWRAPAKLSPSPATAVAPWREVRPPRATAAAPPARPRSSTVLSATADFLAALAYATDTDQLDLAGADYSAPRPGKAVLLEPNRAAPEPLRSRSRSRSCSPADWSRDTPSPRRRRLRTRRRAATSSGEADSRHSEDVDADDI